MAQTFRTQKLLDDEESQPPTAFPRRHERVEKRPLDRRVDPQSVVAYPHGRRARLDQNLTLLDPSPANVLAQPVLAVENEIVENLRQLSSIRPHIKCVSAELLNDDTQIALAPPRLMVFLDLLQEGGECYDLAFFATNRSAGSRCASCFRRALTAASTCRTKL